MTADVTLAVIGGSGAHEILSRRLLGVSESVAAVKTPFGDVQDIRRFTTADGLQFYFLPRHGASGYTTAAPFVNYRANIWSLKELGVERIIAWSGPGIINPAFETGALAAPHDLIDQTRRRHSTFFEKGGLGFIRMSDPFCPHLRGALGDAMEHGGLPRLDRAVYLCTEGPRLETPAEIRMFGQWGADLVGMTLIPETFLARELEMCYAALCYLTNFAEGVAERTFERGVLFEGMLSPEEKAKVDAALERAPELIVSSLRRAAAAPRGCMCGSAMLRYKKRGDIGGDWREWIKK